MPHSWPFVCPRCHGRLAKVLDSHYYCLACSRKYPLRRGIPDFTLAELVPGRLGLQHGQWFDWLAPIYDWKFFYPPLLRIYAGLRVSYREVLKEFAALLGETGGKILDLGCGPATLARRLRGPGREFYGVDVSLRMLQMGRRLAAAEGVQNLELVRGLAEALPFPEAFFEAAVCGVSLHLLPDPGQGLEELHRVLKPGAPFVASTIIAGREGLFRFAWFRPLALRFGVRTFSLPELKDLAAQAGFQDFLPRIFGSLVLFRCRRDWKLPLPGERKGPGGLFLPPGSQVSLPPQGDWKP